IHLIFSNSLYMSKKFSGLLTKSLLIIFLCCFTVVTAFALDEYNGEIKGTVSTLDGKPVAWVTVHVKTSAISAITDENGVFTFKNLRPGTYTLVISYSGAEQSEKTITVTDDKITKTEFTLQETAKRLNEIFIDGRKSSNLQPVTIGKIPAAPMDIPQSITVIGQNVIRDQQSQKLSD